MKINPTKSIAFGYKSILKSEWLKGNMPSVTRGLYGGTLTPDNITLEHIIPHSKGGKTSIENLALATNINNCQRSSKPLQDCLDKKAIDEYLEQFNGITLPEFSGTRYIQALKKTINRVLKQR